ncbi:hypothetical protein KSB_61050 [Ktedonobacter robiniae]|uniref:Uncharacterized protein n=1 Tax=Ktedonobacter robiniae TaxID=2778365 RepID=A0ABQ3UY64_9CHLR|nr:hypothetical protein KSB_61050 [Ktedonobacter robiniae]
MLARDALMNIPQRLLETGKPVAMKVARRVWEGAVGKGLALVSTSLAAYFKKFNRSNTTALSTLSCRNSGGIQNERSWGS